MACIHSARANRVVEEALRERRVDALAHFTGIDREVKYGERSRADLRLRHEGMPDCFIEVKCVTLCRRDGVGLFPDAVSQRARRHLLELASLSESGRRAVIFFCVFHEGIREVHPAFDIDPAYCDALQTAIDRGVEAMAWGARISPAGITLDRELPVVVGR
jgi:sugar fermentation stimulation protein A